MAANAAGSPAAGAQAFAVAIHRMQCDGQRGSLVGEFQHTLGFGQAQKFGRGHGVGLCRNPEEGRWRVLRGEVHGGGVGAEHLHHRAVRTMRGVVVLADMHQHDRGECGVQQFLQ